MKMNPITNITKSDIAFFIIGRNYGFDLAKNIDFVMKSQYWSDQQIADYQSAGLQKIIRHAYDHVPYYRNMMDRLHLVPGDIRKTCDLEKLPVTRKSDLMANAEHILARNFQKYHPIKRSTGGTTGIAFPYYNDMKSWGMNWAIKIRTFRWGGYEFSRDRLGVLAGGSLLSEGSSGVRSMLWKYLNNYIPLLIMHTDDESLEAYFRKLKRKNVRFLRGYPTAIFTFAKYLKKKNLQLPMLSIFTTAEMLHDHQRRLMEEIFCCRVFDQYGCGDGMGGASECEHHEGLHVNFESSVFTLMDKTGKEVQAGKEGEVVLTSLNDFAMPFIRYAPGDLGIMSSQKCSCGRNLSLLQKIIGRTSDLIELPNGRSLNGLSVPFEEWDDRIVRFQIVQTEPDLIEVNLVPKETYSAKDDETVFKVMQTHAGEGIRIIVNHVKDIPLSESGKFRFVISKVTKQK
jgi:phenylacetate-CoA ligase